MAYKSYLTKQYDHTQENAFFRAFSAQLRRKFAESEGLNILIGNISCNGHQIDALFISKGKIIVIDFKNYGGALTFSENNPWQISNGADFVFVKGGGGIRNPYQQVSAYRFSLIQFLSNRQSQFLDPNHENFDLGHINSMVLFQMPIKFDQNSISATIRYYFFIADSTTCISAVMDRNSIKLNLSDNELVNILTALDIRDENLYNETREPEIPEELVSPQAAERLEQVRIELSRINFNNKTEIQKLLLYYQTLISLERVKEPSISDIHSLAFNWRTVTDSILLNIEGNTEFHVKFQRNLHQQYPKNFFVGINVQLNGQNVFLLHNVISTRDILNHASIECPVSDFALYSKSLEERSYPEELIEQLASAVNQKNTIAEKIEVLREQLGGVVELVQNITVGFSEGNLFTAQLLSEVKKINQDNLVLTNSLLESFLLKKAVKNTLQQENPSEFIRITPLNLDQYQAIKLSFDQPLTVITGPPGTGKTQVVLNILANAVLRNKKVLLASKLNQAVDNVKDRLVSLISEPSFFLRFGSKTEIRDKTRPIINSYVNRIHNSLLQDNSVQLSEIRNTIKEKQQIISRSRSEIEKRKKIETNCPVLEGLIVNNEKNFQAWKDTNIKAIAVFSNHPKEILDALKNQNNLIRNEVLSKNRGVGKLLFNLISRRKYAVILTSSFESLSADLKEFATTDGLNIQLSTLRSAEDIILGYKRINEFLEKGVDIHNSLKNFENTINAFKYQLDEANRQKAVLLQNEPRHAQLISENAQAINRLGVPFLNELIHSKIRKGDAADINRYTDYIPDAIPWRTDEILPFIETTKSFIETFNICAITSLSVKSAFPLTNELFDLVVIDEASQCDVASALPLIFRAKQLVIIGDSMQLKHISKVQRYEEKYIVSTLGLNPNLLLDYVNESLFDYCYKLSITSKSQGVFLKQHFRCHPDIINYSNKAFYRPLMGQDLEILTSLNNYKRAPSGIFWHNTNGIQHLQKNSNQLESRKAIDLAIELAGLHPEATIGITTPFAHQAKDIADLIPMNLTQRVKAATVHSFQGDEKDFMIISLVVTSNSPDYKAQWINNRVPYLINVAVTRARNTVYIIGNANYCKTLPGDSALGILVRYVDGINPIN